MHTAYFPELRIAYFDAIFIAPKYANMKASNGDYIDERKMA